MRLGPADRRRAEQGPDLIDKLSAEKPAEMVTWKGDM